MKVYELKEYDQYDQGVRTFVNKYELVRFLSVYLYLMQDISNVNFRTSHYEYENQYTAEEELEFTKTRIKLDFGDEIYDYIYKGILK